MSIFETVKNNVSLPEAAQLYGIKVSRHRKALCPFHNDRNPSLFVADDHYHCFACGEHGDVIDFVSRLFRLSPYDAALKLIADFHLDPDKPPSAAALQAKKIKIDAQKLRDQERLCVFVLSDYRNRLKDWKKNYAPGKPEDSFHDCFMEACHRLEEMEYYLDILTFGFPEERQEATEYWMSDGRIHTLKERLESIKEKEERDGGNEYQHGGMAA